MLFAPLLPELLLGDGGVLDAAGAEPEEGADGLGVGVAVSVTP